VIAENAAWILKDAQLNKKSSQYNYGDYNRYKLRLMALGLPEQEYEIAIRKLCEVLGI